MIFLHSTISSLKSIFGMVMISSPSFSSYCSCWTSGTGWLQLSSVLCFSSYFALSRSQSFGLLCLPMALLLSCLPLALLLSCLPLALLLSCLLLALLFSVLFIIAPDLRCSSRCPRTLVALLRFSRHKLVGCGSFCGSSESLCGRLRLRGSFLASLKHHHSALRPS